jgi:flagellar hook protein FlgE
MSLTGTLLSGVAGLKAQTNAMAILSDNISNINTIGYKKSIAEFSTLVVNSAASTTYSPGGVKSGRFALVDNQGVLQSSNRPLDVAITGNGFFAVNDAGNGLGNSLYTRAGSFHEDNQGRLVNANGVYLMGWALDQTGNIANINQLNVVSVGTLNGVAVDTQNVTIGANLNSQQTIFGGNTLQSLGVAPPGPASSTTDLGVAGANLIADQDEFTLTVNGATTTYKYVDPTTAVANPANDEFVTLADLANLIDNTTDVSATIAGSPPVLSITSPYAVTLADLTNTPATAIFGATLTIPATYSAGGATISNANASITSSTFALTGGGVLNAGEQFTITANGSAHTFTAGTSTGQFDDLSTLVSQINASAPQEISAYITGPAGAPVLNIHSAFPLTITDVGTGVVADTLLNAVPTTAPATFTQAAATAGMQSGSNTPQFTTQQLQVFDSLGTSHIVTMGFIRVDTNRWAYELYTPDTEIAGVAAGRGLISAGNITFNGDGTLNQVTGTPTFYSGTPPAPTPININWANGASASDISFNLGTPGALGTGRANGLTQFAANNTVSFVNQDGSAVGLRTGVSIDKDGFVIASFSNGATQKIYQVPITTFADPTALQAENGNTFKQTVASGSFNWRIANSGGAGSIEPSSLESSNADLGDEFSNMIITQRAYSANAKTITTADDMLQELLQIKR